MNAATQEAGAAVTVAGLRVERGEKLVIPGLDVELPAGRITGLLGPSGSGKSTLLRSIVGVQRIAGGTVTVLGRPAGSAELRHEVGYMTQAPSVYGDLTAGENLRFFARVLGLGDAAVATALDAVGLEAQREQHAGTMSGGQRARVSLATALLGRPRVLILDEPTVGLDPVLRDDLWFTFAELAAAGTTLIVSSHVMDEAERSDSLMLIREGELLATGTPGELRDRTGADDVGEAFLRLIRARDESEVASR
jgi:ABC-2 type transport system ATP-binding protein